MTPLRKEAKMKLQELLPLEVYQYTLTLLHSERPKLHRVLAILSAIGLRRLLNIGKWNVEDRAKMKLQELLPLEVCQYILTLLHSERPKLHWVLAILSAIGFRRLLNIRKWNRDSKSKCNRIKLKVHTHLGHPVLQLVPPPLLTSHLLADLSLPWNIT